MQRTIRPIWGFGWWGWILLPVAAALTYCYLGGYDLRFAIIRWWFDSYGWAGTSWLLSSLQFRYYVSLWSPVFGPICLMYLLLSLFLVPRRWGWWVWCLAVVWTIAQPALWWELGNSGFRFVGAWLSTTASFAASGTLLGLVTVLALWVLTRSRWVVGTVLGATAAALAFDAYGTAAPTPAIPVWVYYAVIVAWHACVAASLLGWAIAERRRAHREPWRCPECAYDLRGTGAGRCPECGSGLVRGMETVPMGPKS